MLVRIHTEKIRLIIPIPLFLIEQSLEAAADLIRLAEYLMPALFSHIKKKTGRKCVHMRPSSIIALCREIFIEIRRYGRWRMVEVESGKQRIYVDFF